MGCAVRDGEKTKGKMMNRTIEIAIMAIAAAIGLAVHGTVGAAIGGVVGMLVGSYAVTSARRASQGLSISISSHEKREMTSAMHLALVVNWALRPMAMADPHVGRQMTDAVFDDVIEALTVEITPHVQEMTFHMRLMAEAGVKPEDSFRHVQRRYGARFGRKRPEVVMGAALIALRAQIPHGAVTEMRQWFCRWCEEVGLKGAGAALWDEAFGDQEIDMADWLEGRRQADLDSYFSQDAAA